VMGLCWLRGRWMRFRRMNESLRFILGADVLSFSGWVGFRGEPGLGPAAEALFFASPKKSTQKKGEPTTGPLRGSLRCSVRPGCAQTRFAQTCAPLFPGAPALLSPVGRQGGGGYGLPFSQPLWLEGKSAPAFRRHALASSAGPGGMRAAHVRRPRSGQVCADPARTEQRSVPAAKRRDSAFGPPFLCLLSFGEAKESEAPAGARPGQTTQPEKTR